MINFFNQRELILTMSSEQLNRVRQILDENRIDYKLSMYNFDNKYVDTKFTQQCYVLVNKKDLVRAKELIT